MAENLNKVKIVYDDIKDNKFKFNKKKWVLWAIIAVLTLLSLYFVSNDEGFYSKPIARIISIDEQASDKTTENGKVEPMKNQKIQAVILNGTYKGRTVALDNVTSFSQANDLDLKVNDEVFLSVTADNTQIISANIQDLKRDKYIVYILDIFILLILLVGGAKGFKSLVSVVVNILIILLTVKFFSKGYYLIAFSIISSILFIIVSILIVSGKNKKSFSAIIGTLAGTVISMAIAGTVIVINNWSGVHFEEMEFLTQPPETIFFIELIIGTLGAIMDIAISISSAVKELYDQNPDVERKVLISSAREIGKDIMGTMSNTLVFAYLSGSIPTLLILLRNGVPVSYIVSMNLSLEFMRAIVGSIGIVLSIPITLYASIIILKNRKIGEVNP